MLINKFSIPPKIFHSEYFEKRYLYLSRAVYGVRYTWDDFSREFFSIDPADRKIRLFSNEELVKESYTSLVQDGSDVRSFYTPGALEEKIKSGALLVVNDFEKVSTYVAGVCRQYFDLTGHRCAGDVYVDGGGNETFGKRWNSHCFFATQLIGKKLWRVYQPTHELSLHSQTNKEGGFECSETPAFEKILSPGDVLYIPRGWWHEAVPLENTPTLHVAAGVYTTKIFDYLKWIMESRMPQVIAARSTIEAKMGDDYLRRVAKELETEILSNINRRDFTLSEMKVIKNKIPINFNSIFM